MTSVTHHNLRPVQLDVRKSALESTSGQTPEFPANTRQNAMVAPADSPHGNDAGAATTEDHQSGPFTHGSQDVGRVIGALRTSSCGIFPSLVFRSCVLTRAPIGLEDQPRTSDRLSEHTKPNLRRRRLRRMGRAIQNQRPSRLRSCLPCSLHAKHAYPAEAFGTRALPP